MSVCMYSHAQENNFFKKINKKKFGRELEISQNTYRIPTVPTNMRCHPPRPTPLNPTLTLTLTLTHPPPCPTTPPHPAHPRCPPVCPAHSLQVRQRGVVRQHRGQGRRAHVADRVAPQAGRSARHGDHPHPRGGAAGGWGVHGWYAGGVG